MDLGIRNKVALITAASRGLGFYSAMALGIEGVKVVINSRDAGHLAAAASELSQLDIEVTAIKGDICDKETPARLVEATMEKYGSIDIVVANANGPRPVRSLDVTDEDILNAVNNNMLATVRLFQNSLKFMKVTGFGRLISISSYSIEQAIPNLSLSNLARKSLFAWTKTAAFDLRDEVNDITMNTICPGVHLTDRIRELHRDTLTLIAGNPKDFGEVVAFIASLQAKFINGAKLVVDGGETLNI